MVAVCPQKARAGAFLQLWWEHLQTIGQACIGPEENSRVVGVAAVLESAQVFQCEGVQGGRCCRTEPLPPQACWHVG